MIQITDNLTGSSKFEDQRADVNLADITIKLDSALTAKQEAEAKATSLEGKVQQYELELTQLKEGVSHVNQFIYVFRVLCALPAVMYRRSLIYDQYN